MILKQISVLSPLLLAICPVFSIPNSRFVRRDSMEEALSLKTARPCSVLDVDDVQSLLGWPKLQKYAIDTWGVGNVTISINPPNYKDKPATLCVVDSSPIILSDDHNCTVNRVEIPPEKGTNVIDVEFGYKNVGQWNITEVSSAAHAELFQAKFQVPEIKDADLKPITTRGEFVNALDNVFETTASNMTTKKTQLPNISEQVCVGTIRSRECYIPAHGRIQFEATGYVWFTFDAARAPVAKPKGAKHKRYTIKIEDVLKDINDRSAWTNFNGTMVATMRSDYFSECKPKIVI